MSQVPVEQICEVRITRIEDEKTKEENERAVIDAIEFAYHAIHTKARLAGKVLMGVTQSINTEGFLLPSGISYVLYTVALVGTVVDVSVVEAQQRMSQFGLNQIDGRNARRN